jgi:peptide-methionine (R)-S-oxide reductase
MAEKAVNPEHEWRAQLSPQQYRVTREKGLERALTGAWHAIAHLGPVFPDGPGPTGQRFCMNSAALKLEPRDGRQ